MLSWIVLSSMTWNDCHGSCIAANCGAVGVRKSKVFSSVVSVATDALTSSEVDDAFTCG